jgi:hypothetical protein
MRTTVELPPDLMRAAKARSAESGESLKALLTRAVAAELGNEPSRSAARARVTLPLFGAASGPRARPSSADLERALADADAAHAGAPAGRRRGRRRRDRAR